MNPPDVHYRIVRTVVAGIVGGLAFVLGLFLIFAVLDIVYHVSLIALLITRLTVASRLGSRSVPVPSANPPMRREP